MKELLFKDMMNFAGKFGLKKDGFSQEQFYKAWIYKYIILNLAYLFAGDFKNVSLSNTEYVLNDNDSVKEISLILEFKNKNMVEFIEFLKKNPQLIPKELRQTLILSAGSNHNRQKVLSIDQKKIAGISKKKWNSECSDGSLTDEIIKHEIYKSTRDFSKYLFVLLLSKKQEL